MTRPLRLLVAVVLVPVLVGAADPSGDAVACRGSGPMIGDPPDLVSATGRIVELGSSALWTLRFARPLEVPDRVGRPFRVDVVLRDPSVTAYDVGFYHDMNRIVRYDALRRPRTDIILIPEDETDSFTPPRIDGRTMRIQIPARLLTEEDEATGSWPELRKFRWTVVVRDENTCDVLGTGATRLPLVVDDTPASTPGPTATPAPVAIPSGHGALPWIPVGLGAGVAGLVALWLVPRVYRRRLRSR